MTAAAPVDFQNAAFDVLIAGSGFGGATAAYALSRAGLRVLLVERGGWPNRDETDWNGRAILLEKRYRGETPLLVRQEGATEAVETLATRSSSAARRCGCGPPTFHAGRSRTPISSPTMQKRKRCSRSTDASAKTPVVHPAPATIRSRRWR
jgi:choline dehydrogenase-like flavoprotein